MTQSLMEGTYQTDYIDQNKLRSLLNLPTFVARQMAYAKDYKQKEYTDRESNSKIVREGIPCADKRRTILALVGLKPQECFNQYKMVKE